MRLMLFCSSDAVGKPVLPTEKVAEEYKDWAQSSSSLSTEMKSKPNLKLPAKLPATTLAEEALKSLTGAKS